MRFLVFCRRCMADARVEYDRTPDPGCRVCSGVGYQGATKQEISHHLAQDPYPRAGQRAGVLT